jgi:outer membrane lipopolysaccharide assembly protein LptE/RlpB
MGFRRTSGTWAAEAVCLLAAVLVAGCNYGFRGGGGMPEHIRTLYIQSFDNETDNFDVQTQLFDELIRELPRSLGVRLGGEASADAILRGRIVRYNDAAQAYRPGETGSIDVQQHQVEITVSVEVIDVRNNLVLWDSQNLLGRGQYRPDTQEPAIAYAQAIESLRQQIVDGTQSQW